MYKLLSFHECLRWKFQIFWITRRQWQLWLFLWYFHFLQTWFLSFTTEDWSYCTELQDFYQLPLASLLHYEFTGNQITSQLAVQSSLGVTLQHFRSARGGPLLLGCVFWLGNTSQWYWLTSEEILGKYSFCMLEIPIFLLFLANNEAIFTNH